MRAAALSVLSCVWMLAACDPAAALPPPGDAGSRPDAGSLDDAMATDARAPDDAGSGDAPPATLDAALTADARPVDAGPGCAIDGGAAPVRFGAIYDGIITANGCASGGCHDGGDPGTGATSRGGFDMTSEAAAYASLVNVTGCRGVRVVPCSPEASYFSEVIRVGDGICAGRRHAQGMLSPDEIAMVDEWIRTGAR